MVTSCEIDARCKNNGFLFFTTHTNDPLLTAIGNTVLDVIVRDTLAENASARGAELLAGLKKLKNRHACIGDVRGRGLMAGIEIVGDRKTKAPNVKLARAIAKSMWQAGIWCQLQDGVVFRIGPPINTTSEEVAEGLRVLECAFSSINASSCDG